MKITTRQISSKEAEKINHIFYGHEHYLPIEGWTPDECIEVSCDGDPVCVLLLPIAYIKAHGDKRLIGSDGKLQRVFGLNFVFEGHYGITQEEDDEEKE